MTSLHDQLRNSLKGRVCLMGLGNLQYGDDGFGVRLAEDLVAAGMPNVVIAGTTPEAYIGRITAAGYAHVVFLDAVDFAAPPASVVFLDAREIEERFPQCSTHKLSLGLLAKWAERSGGTRAWLLGVQPESLAHTDQLTRSVAKTLEMLKELLIALSSSQLVDTRFAEVDAS